MNSLTPNHPSNLIDACTDEELYRDALARDQCDRPTHVAKLTTRHILFSLNDIAKVEHNGIHASGLTKDDSSRPRNAANDSNS